LSRGIGKYPLFQRAIESRIANSLFLGERKLALDAHACSDDKRGLGDVGGVRIRPVQDQPEVEVKKPQNK